MYNDKIIIMKLCVTGIKMPIKYICHHIINEFQCHVNNNNMSNIDYVNYVKAQKWLE